MKTNIGSLFLLSLTAITLANLGCQKKATEAAATAPSTTPSRYLYFSAGACYVGGLTASKVWSASTSGVINKINLGTAALQGQNIVDYNAINAGDFPVGIADYSSVDSNYLLALIENTGGRRIDLVPRSGATTPSTWKVDSTGLPSGATVVRNLVATTDGFLAVKSTAIEKYSNGKNRVTANATSYVNNPQGSCLTSNTAMTGVTISASGTMFFIHGAATPNNKIGVVVPAGTATNTAADCLTTAAAPTTTARPTSIVFVPPSQILVSWVDTAPARDYIYAYDVTETGTAPAITAATLTNATDITSTIYSAGIIRGISAMAWDSTGGNLYVANGSTSMANTIEKFTYVSSSKTLTRVGTVPWFPAANDTQCINSMFVGN